MSTAIVLLVTAAALLFLIHAARGGGPRATTPEELRKLTTAIDLAAFRNLISPQEDSYLKAQLPAVDFRRVHRARRQAALEYVKIVARNAGILLRMAESGRTSPDPVVAAVAQELVNSALQLRMHALLGMTRLYIGIRFPQFDFHRAGIVDRYESLTERVVYFVSVNHPKQTSAVSASL
ncbi:MAG TPA: hypothetical protein VN622_07365 [Clostridia bacterium]|nr:hypothetical protein [Clostridia bacterium]